MEKVKNYESAEEIVAAYESGEIKEHYPFLHDAITILKNQNIKPEIKFNAEDEEESAWLLTCAHEVFDQLGLTFDYEELSPENEIKISGIRVETNHEPKTQ